MLETLNVEDLEPGHVQALAGRPDSALGRLAREQILERFESRISNSLHWLGLDESSHRHAVRDPADPQSIHLEKPVDRRSAKEKHETWCGIRVSWLKPVRRDEAGASIAKRADACRFCLRAAEAEGFYHTDHRPPAAVFGAREEAVHETLSTGFDEVVRSDSIERFHSLISAVAADERTRKALTEEISELILERLRRSETRLGELVGFAHHVAEQHRDLLVRDLLRPAGVRRAAEELILTGMVKSPLVAVLTEALAHRKADEVPGREGAAAA